MKSFLNENFLLETKTAEVLYHDFAEQLPIIDYHCHLPPDEIANNVNFENLTQIWLYGDHYKWRAMRANGVDEAYITGNKSDWEKFETWAATVPFTLRNPLYHWTHLELKRYFNINQLLSPTTAKRIYDECNEKLQTPEFAIKNLIANKKVEVVCTTDDPIDDLAWHKKIKQDGYKVKVLPTFRPDKALFNGNLGDFASYKLALEKITDHIIADFNSYLLALKTRHNYFGEQGCRLSDHGLEHMYAELYTEEEVNTIFKRILSGEPIDKLAASKLNAALLHEFAIWGYEKGWVQQFHLGALRGNNTGALIKLGADTGYDSIGDFSQGVALSRFLDRLQRKELLTKTILYNLNPADNEMFATMAGNFNDGSLSGKMQYGSAWWFLDQKDGMEKQLNTISNMGLISKMVGMLTDSRSFLSYPRHEYFRRILCNLFGNDIEKGELPDDINWTGKIIQDICYYNAKNYFNFDKII